MRLFLGLPTAGAPAAPFTESLRGLRLPAGMHAFERAIVTGNFVPAQRDVIVERALAWGADVVAMCDDDMILPPDALEKLCEVLASDPDSGLAGALYYSRDGLRPMAVDGWDATDNRQGWIPAFDDRTPVRAGGVGFGCVAIRAAALRAMTPPFFAAQIYVERAAGRVRVCNEDYLFCARLREHGYATVLHPGVRCKHYDRGRDRAEPVHWEPVERTAIKRVLARTGERYALIPLEDAGAQGPAERHVNADVVYVNVD